MVTPGASGRRWRVGLPSSMTAATSGNLVSGVSDVAFVGSQMYALLAGAGCSHGVADVPNGVVSVASNGSWTMLANLSEFIQNNPVRNPGADFQPDGTFYSMVSVGSTLYVDEPNRGSIERVTTSGAISRLVDVSASQGHAVPTALAHHGVFYVGNLGTFGSEDQAGDQHVYQVTPNGHLKIKSSRLEKVTGLAFVGGKEYALEMSTAAGGPVPGTGTLVRVQAGRVTQTIASDDVPDQADRRPRRRVLRVRPGIRLPGRAGPGPRGSPQAEAAPFRPLRGRFPSAPERRHSREGWPVPRFGPTLRRG